MSQQISSQQKRELRKQVHHLKPVVMVGQHGLSDNVFAELEIALDHHELIKIRISAGDKEERKQLLERILERTGAALVQTIGHVAALYREKPE